MDIEFKGRLADRIIHAMTGRLKILLAAPGHGYHGRKYESGCWQQGSDEV
jgi:hypothetical protein